MALKSTEKVAVGAIRQALQVWLAPQLASISERLAHVEGRLDGFEKSMEGGFAAAEQRVHGLEQRMADSSATAEQRVHGLEQRMADGFAAAEQHAHGFEQRMADGFVAINARLDDLRDSLKIHERFARLEAERGLKSETSS